MNLRNQKIKGVIVHCSASDRYAEDDIENVKELHTSKQGMSWNHRFAKGRGWDDVGYNFYINFNGDIQLGRDLKYSGAHAKGYNDSHIGICLSGLNNVANPAQRMTLTWLIMVLREQYDMKWEDIIPHNKINKYKTCPNFNMDEFKAAMGGPK